MAITTLEFISIGFTLKVWRKWLRYRTYLLFSRLRIKRNRRGREKLERQYWVFGSARSGTTWLMEVLQRGFALQSIFEPTHQHNPTYPRNNEAKAPLIATDLKQLAIEEGYIKDLVAGKLTSQRILQGNPPIRFRKVRGVVLKDIDERLMQIPAFIGLHDPMIPVVIMRQPMNVLRSALVAHKAWRHEDGFKSHYLIDFLELNKHLLSADAQAIIQGVWQRLGNDLDYRQTVVAKWCIHNLIALQMQAGNPRLKVVEYEKMDVPGRAGVDYLETVLGKFDFNPGLTRRSFTDVRQPRASLSTIERETAEVLRLFGLGSFVTAERPFELDFDALVADYRDSGSARLAPRFMR